MTKVNWKTSNKGMLLTLVLVGAACHREGTQPGAGATANESKAYALTAAEADRVLGFEATTTSDWAVIQNGPGTLSVSTTVSQGSRSLAVLSRGYVPLQSIALPSLGSRVENVIHYDIMPPTELARVSPYYYGATQLYLDIPSLGLYNAFVGQVDIMTLPLGQWSTLTFTPPSDALTKLRGSYADLRVRIVVNAPYNMTKPYLLDNLRFSNRTLALVTVVDGSGHPISGLVVTAYNGSVPTSNTGVTDGSGVAKIWAPQGSYRFGVTEAGVTTFSGPSNQCQVPGICQAATIIARCHQVPVPCAPADQCHEAGVCIPQTGSCWISPKADETPCDDGGLCTAGDACHAGSCTGTQTVTCTALDACHNAGTCDPLSGLCNNPVKAGCTVSATHQWTSGATGDSLFGAVVPRSNGTFVAAGRSGPYHVAASGTVTPFTPAVGGNYVVDPADGAYVGAIVGSDFVVYDIDGVEKQRVSRPAYAGVDLVPGHPVALLKLMNGPNSEHLNITSVRFVGESKDVTIAVSDLRRSLATRDYFVHTTSSETIVHDYSGAELHRYSSAADLMAASVSSKALAFVVHGTAGVVRVQLPSGTLGTPTTLDAPVWNLVLSPDGRFMAATTKQKVSLFLDGALINTVAVPVAFINSVDVSNEGLVVLGTQDSDGSTRLWSTGPQGVNGFSISRPSKETRGYHPDVRFLPNGQAFLSSERDGVATFNLSLVH